MHYPCSIISNVVRECYIAEADAARAWRVMEEVMMVVQLAMCELGKVVLCHDRYTTIGDVGGDVGVGEYQGARVV